MNVSEFNQSDRCEHVSCPERSVSPAVYILLYVCSAAVVLLTVCGNLLVIISVLHFKQLHTPSNMLVLSLAVTDFFVGVFVMPLMLIWTIESCWIFGRHFCTTYWWFAGVITVVSIYNIAVISVDRYVALSNPFLYMNKVSVRITCIIIIFDWCAVAAYISALLYFNENFMNHVMCPGECFLYMNYASTIVHLIYSFILPLSIIIILYSLVFVIAKKHATAIRELNNHTRPKTQKITSHSMKSERKAAKVLGILVSVFLVFLFPYFIYTILSGVIEIQTETFPKILIVLNLNSTINPIIYTLFYPWFRKCSELILTLQIFQANSALFHIL